MTSTFGLEARDIPEGGAKATVAAAVLGGLAGSSCTLHTAPTDGLRTWTDALVAAAKRFDSNTSGAVPGEPAYVGLQDEATRWAGANLVFLYGGDGTEAEVGVVRQVEKPADATGLPVGSIVVSWLLPHELDGHSPLEGWLDTGEWTAVTGDCAS